MAMTTGKEMLIFKGEKAERMIQFLNSGEPRLKSLLGQGLKRSIAAFKDGTEGAE